MALYAFIYADIRDMGGAARLNGQILFAIGLLQVLVLELTDNQLTVDLVVSSFLKLVSNLCSTLPKNQDRTLPN